MEEYGFTLTMDDSLEAFLGIKFERMDDGAFNLTQPALIEKIIKDTGMSQCNRSPTPAAPNQPLGKDPDGADFAERWSYPSVIGMLMVIRSLLLPKFFSTRELAALGEVGDGELHNENEGLKAATVK